ncbi:peptide chain release factor N(5)-glutamine methyltransferase [Thalassobacillus devorans]|uniref:peptide chain release factor N(5)-glutamine methyltransferase n=1 Tax=Thalassobacillus devorans TaxID=279813 RepID=UPI00048E386B|nr:peptide chain release factor N(5)-glutamine methyltransferase [Thalassobacillus devorans]
MEQSFTTIQEARKWASLFLKEQQREPGVADWLLEHHLNMSYTQLMAYGRDPFPHEKKTAFVADIYKHTETGIPVQHLIGEAEFYGRRFKVNGDVLIPRPETEELVEGVLRFIEKKGLNSEYLKVVDLGTGSGAIACTLSLELDHLDVYATDISSQALETTARNAHQLDAKVKFYQGDFLAPVAGEAIDIIVSNPPYISLAELKELSDTVVRFDPHLALFADDEGLAAYQTIIRQIKSYHLRPMLIAFEIGHRQGEAVKAIIETELPGYHAEVRSDINGYPRMVFAYTKASIKSQR